MRRSVLMGAMAMVMVFWVLPSAALAQTPPDVLYLEGGGMVRGTIVENVPGDHVTIQLATGEVRTFASAQVVRVAMGEGTPPPPPAAIIVAPPPDPGVSVHVTASSPDLILHRLTGTASVTVWTNNGVGSAAIDQFEPICGAPCDTHLPAGTYTFGISSGGGTPRRAGHPPFRVDREMSLEMEYESREGIRIGGWVIFGLGTAAFLGLALAPLATGSTDLTFLLAGGIVYSVTLIPFFIMAFMNDHADVNDYAEGIRF